MDHHVPQENANFGHRRILKQSDIDAEMSMENLGGCSTSFSQ